MNACRRIRKTQVLPVVSIKKYANSMSLLKADMPIRHKDPPKDVDGGMAELKEPGEEGEDRHHFEEDERLAQDCLVCFAKTVLVFGFKREHILATLTVMARFSHCPTLPNTRALPANRTRSVHPHYLFLLLEVHLFLIPSATQA